jgi:4-amino-4-deoxy-L-arabinose transferase-like glycosyltransferase
MVREMAATGPVLHPRLHGGLYPDYPPLYFWAGIPVVKAVGDFTPLAVRIQSVIGAALLALGTALIGLRLASARTALVAGVLVSVIPALAYEERRAMIDPLFSGLACMAVALLAFSGWRTFIPGCIFLALTWLTKGPLGAVVVALALAGGEGLDFAVEPRGVKLKWLNVRAVLLALAVALIAFSWFKLAYVLYGQEFGDNLLKYQTWGRFSFVEQHRKPWHFYLATTLPALLPLLAFAVFGVRRTRVSLFALGWFVAVLFFFSVSKTKRSYYPMPAYPAVALLAASFFETKIPQWAERLWQGFFSWALVLAVFVGAILGFYSKDLVPYGAAVSVGAFLGWFAFRGLVARRKPALAVAAALGFVLAAIFASAIPALARRHGDKDLYAALTKLGVKRFAVSPGGIHREALCFWFGHPPLEGMPNIESQTNGPDAEGCRAWLDQFPAGEAAVILQREKLEGTALDPLRDPHFVKLGASDDEESAEAYIAIGRRP